MEKLCGVVERLTYINEEKGYSVIKIAVKGYSGLVTVVGNISPVHVGSVVTISGEWTTNPKYGRQFNAESWEESVPSSIYGLEKYLGSGLIKGVGPKYAKLIVKQFGPDTLRVIEEEPQRLIEIPNIGQKRVAMITKAWKEQKEIKNIMLFLNEYDVSTAFGYRIYKAYGNDSVQIVQENPYRLIDDIWGIGFQTADKIALKLGMQNQSYARCRGGIFYTLNQLANDGHCFAIWDDLVKKCVEILSVDESVVVMTLDYLTHEKELFREEGHNIYLPPFYYAEIGVARKIQRIMRLPVRPISNIDAKIREIESASGVQYDETQREAIRFVVSSKVSVLTGGPGTGKTTITRAIIEIFRQSGQTVLLAAPTGRAAKRMSEACGMEAKTIHRMLESKPPEGFQRNEKNPLSGDVLVVDEASMIDLLLMYNLLKALPDGMTVVFVGDVDQLPSVGAGNVLADLINSGVVPVVKLTKIFRQALHSQIIINAHKVNRGEVPNLKGGPHDDFFFLPSDTPEQIADEIIRLCAKRLPKAYKINPITNIQVLTPMRRGTAGTDHLNHVLQAALNPSPVSLLHGGIEYRLGDKVMQVKNDYTKDVFNGDIGCVSGVDREGQTLTVDFDGRKIAYEMLELDELVLSYAITIHKSQGGEFPVVIMPITSSHAIMLQRNLLYTAITRAKRLMILIGEQKAVYTAVKNNRIATRNTMLAERLKAKNGVLPSVER